MASPDQRDILFYGAEWCRDCRTSKRLLDQEHVVFTYKDIEKDLGARSEFDAMVGDGPHSIPRILFRRGDPEKGMTVVGTLVEPSIANLRNTLVIYGYISQPV